MGAQPHGNEQFLAAVEDLAEQTGKAPGAERTRAGPIGIGGWGWRGSGERCGHPAPLTYLLTEVK
jgi:hypothetical protein